MNTLKFIHHCAASIGYAVMLGFIVFLIFCVWHLIKSVFYAFYRAYCKERDELYKSLRVEKEKLENEIFLQKVKSTKELNIVKDRIEEAESLIYRAIKICCPNGVMLASINVNDYDSVMKDLWAYKEKNCKEKNCKEENCKTK